MQNNFTSLDMSLQEKVYRDFFKLVYGVSMNVLKDHSTAEDIVQEAFLKTIYNAPTFETEQQLRAWIKVVARNLTFNVLRKNKYINNYVDIEDIVYNKANRADESTEKEIEVKLFKEKITESLTQINPDYRKIIELKWKWGKSNRDISQELDLTEGAAKLKLFRARKALKRKIQGWRESR